MCAVDHVRHGGGGSFVSVGALDLGREIQGKKDGKDLRQKKNFRNLGGKKKKKERHKKRWHFVMA